MIKKLGYTSIYTTTNETLEAIVRGLDVNEQDTVLAICGSGDQAFALLERAERVIAVDANPDQVAYAKKRAKILKRKGYLPLCPSMNKVNREYMKEERIERIREKSNNIEFVRVKDIFNELEKFQGIKKLYLSNVLCSINVISEIAAISNSLNTNGVAYFTNRALFYLQESLWAVRSYGLCTDEVLTERARQYEKTLWTPEVYRKAA